MSPIQHETSKWVKFKVGVVCLTPLFIKEKEVKSVPCNEAIAAGVMAEEQIDESLLALTSHFAQVRDLTVCNIVTYCDVGSV